MHNTIKRNGQTFVRPARLPRGVYGRSFGQAVSSNMANAPLKWSNLKANLCPRCHVDFTRGLQTRPDMRSQHKGQGKLLTHECGFAIHEKKYEQIVNNMVNQSLDQEEDDL